MQKKIIALAIAGLASSAAFAQTNVTIYGVADAYVSWTNTNAGTATRPAGTAGNTTEKHGRDALGVGSGGLSGSRLGFKGTEDLGNGLKAIFVLEYGLDLVNNVGVGVGNAATGNTLGGSAVARQQLVGLTGGFGQVSLGRQYAPAYAASIRNDAFSASGALSTNYLMTNGFIGGTVNAGSNARWDNSVVYNTPTFGGVTVSTIYQGGAQPNELGQREGYGIGVNYAGGPVNVDYVYQNATMLPGSTTGFPSGVRKEEHYLGASFDAKVVKLFASAQAMDQGNRAASGLSNRGFGYTLGAAIPVTAKANVLVSFSQGDLNANTRARLVGGQTLVQGDFSAVAAGLTYSMSKRTTLYTGYIYSDRDQKDSVASGVGVTNLFAAGINHAF